MLLALALLAVLGVGIVVGLVWRGAVIIGDRRALDRLAGRLDAERRMTAATHATVQAMRQMTRQQRP